MDIEVLEQRAAAIVAHGKGILAADESNGSANKRLASVNLPEDEDTRRRYRQLLISTPALASAVNGIILYDETFNQSNDQGQSFPQYLTQHKIMPGIKVDLGLVDLPGFDGEQVTQGLDGLPEHIEAYAKAGAPFAKWRSVIKIGEGIPTDEAIGANTFVLARYARICQEYNVVPFIEPEILFEGEHTIEQCEQVMAHVYDILFQTLRAFRVHLPGAILKSSMVLPGKQSGNEIDADDVAERTVRVLHEHVPHELGGVVFLSGGQTPEQAFRNLNRIAQRGPHPWGVTFSFSRALQDPVLKHWAQTSNISESQEIFTNQLQQAVQATKGTLDESSLTTDTFVTEGQN